LMIPLKLEPESLASYSQMSDGLAAPDGGYFMMQPKLDSPTFSLIDLNSSPIKSSAVTLPVASYSQAGVNGVSHSFRMVKWDAGGRYLLIKHTFGDNSEWLTFDTRDASKTENISRLLSIGISDIDFADNSGSKFFALSSGDLRKLDISAATISKPLASSVSSFSVYDQGIITYIASVDGARIVGLYRDGSDAPIILRTISNQSVKLSVAATRYFNEDYVVIATGHRVDILGGSFPTSPTDNSLNLVSSFMSNQEVNELSFSPTGEFVVARNGADLATFDIEHQSSSQFSIAGSADDYKLKWLNDNYLWSNRDGSLVIEEFDGANTHNIGQVTVGQDVLISENSNYLYYFSDAPSGYELKRLSLIAE
jgi:hypothetical protein